jgi:hypothetical protein
MVEYGKCRLFEGILDSALGFASCVSWILPLDFIHSIYSASGNALKVTNFKLKGVDPIHFLSGYHLRMIVSYF